LLYAQHNFELYNDGALVHIQAGAEVHVWGDVHNYQATGDLQNNGLLKVQGNMYSDDLFRQQGTGTTRIENSDVNVGERQFISGSYAVRSTGSSAKGTAADGSFYDLELMNDQGMVYLVNTVGGAYDKYVADVRNSVHYNLGALMNRLITADIGMTGAPVYPANGSSYPAIFGMMNPTSPLGGAEGWRQNTVQMHGNMSNVDWGYVQGKMRQQIDATTGYQYPFVVGVEPGGPGMQKGMQYARIDFSTGADYDVLEAYFESALPNAFTPTQECSSYLIDYFGGADHGQWVFDNPAGGSTPYQMNVWPQDDNMGFYSVYLITKDNGISGFSNECGPSPVGLSRGGFSGFSTFGLAGGNIICSTTGTDTQTVCDSYTWIDGNTYTMSNNSASVVLTNSLGCDSTVTLDLTITNSNTGTDTQTACDSYTWIDGMTYTTSNNSATSILMNTEGCDSTVTLDLTITNSTTGTDTQTACDSYTWIDGNTYTTSNNSATWILMNAEGCDSTVTLGLTITNSNTGTDTQTACDSYTWIDGITYTTSNNSATSILMNTEGCDSTVTLDLTITNSNTGTDTQTACDSYTWIDGITYTTSNNSATSILMNTAGCDSTVTLDLTINDSYSLSVDSTILDTDLPFTWNGIEFLDSGTDSATLSTVSGCDSVVTMNVTVTTTVSIIEDPITFETAIDLYPNPVNNELTILFTLKEDTPCTLNLYNTLGQLVFTKSMFKEKGETKELIQLKNLSDGSYHLKVFLKNQDLVYWNKILKL
jgi:hypothetical protein